jgi:hypothetical protein
MENASKRPGEQTRFILRLLWLTRVPADPTMSPILSSSLSPNASTFFLHRRRLRCAAARPTPWLPATTSTSLEEGHCACRSGLAAGTLYLRVASKFNPLPTFFPTVGYCPKFYLADDWAPRAQLWRAAGSLTSPCCLPVSSSTDAAMDPSAAPSQSHERWRLLLW